MSILRYLINRLSVASNQFFTVTIYESNSFVKLYATTLLARIKVVLFPSFTSFLSYAILTTLSSFIFTIINEYGISIHRKELGGHLLNPFTLEFVLILVSFRVG